MKVLQEIEGMDICLLDQIMKGIFNENQKILDAGCGTGRNLKFFLKNQFNCAGIDPREDVITELKLIFPENKGQFFNSTIEDFQDPEGYDAIICNAVLHFAKDHDHFDLMFNNLVDLLQSNGILFIRMTSDIGLNLNRSSEDGVYELPDQTSRYLITERKISDLLNKYSIELKEPIKTVNVNNLRFMTTLVMTKL
jgi:2-polyprenyl-3-methyl-5-hydroxy-6-metoxy-1,4-benzoquinol methylase|tara:strand:- start:1195 stop:1779 length:585 start_codon:yes stop_codon:yes gene_type:complete